MIAIDSVTDWIVGNFTLDDSDLDYITVNEPSGKARSWIVVAQVRASGRNPESVAGDVWRHIENVMNSAAESGKEECAVRLNLYRNKGPAGSRTWRQSVTPNGGDIDDTAEDKPSKGIESEALRLMAQQNTELKQLVMKTIDANMQMARMGYEVAAKAQSKADTLQEQNAELQTLVAAQQVQSESNKSVTDEVVTIAATAIVDLVKGYAAHKMNESSAKQIEEKKE